MNTRFEIGKVSGSRPVWTMASFNNGTLRGQSPFAFAPVLDERFLQQRDAARPIRFGRAPRAHPAIGEPRGPADRIRVADSHPDRRMRLLHPLLGARVSPPGGEKRPRGGV